jgi:hypothetical protein
MSDDVTLEHRLVGGQPVVWVAGELDAFAVEPIRRLVGEVVTPSARGIVLVYFAPVVVAVGAGMFLASLLGGLKL